MLTSNGALGGGAAAACAVYATSHRWSALVSWSRQSGPNPAAAATTALRGSGRREAAAEIGLAGGVQSGDSLDTSSLASEDVESAASCVTLSSSAAIDALINGVPVFVEDTRSFAYGVANLDIKNINNPINNERETLFKSIANTHWSIEEIKNGKCWFFLKKILKKN